MWGGNFMRGLCVRSGPRITPKKANVLRPDRRTSNFKQILVPITAVPTLARVERYAGLTNALVDYRQHLVSHTGVQEEMVAVLGNVSLGTGLLTDTDALKLLDQQITFDRSEWKTLANQNVTTLASNNHYVGIGFRKFDVVNNTIEFPVPTFYDVFTAEVISNEMGRNTKLCLRSTFEPCVDFVKRQSLQGSFEAMGSRTCRRATGNVSPPAVATFLRPVTVHARLNCLARQSIHQCALLQMCLDLMAQPLSSTISRKPMNARTLKNNSLIM